MRLPLHTCTKGPTVVMPGSHFFSVDRAGHWTSEDRIQASAIPPNPDRLRTQLLATVRLSATVVAIARVFDVNVLKTGP
jgi:hypothetical protein